MSQAPRGPIELLMQRHGWDGYATAMAWADAHRRGPRSPWWPEVTQAIQASFAGQMAATLVSFRVMAAGLRRQMDAMEPVMRAVFGRLTPVPRVAHPLIPARLTPPVPKLGVVPALPYPHTTTETPS